MKATQIEHTNGLCQCRKSVLVTYTINWHKGHPTATNSLPENNISPPWSHLVGTLNCSCINWLCPWCEYQGKLGFWCYYLWLNIYDKMIARRLHTSMDGAMKQRERRGDGENASKKSIILMIPIETTE